MGILLPTMKYSENISKQGLYQFGGYYHRYNCGGGQIYDMQNMSSRLYPVLTPRKKRYLVSTLTAPKGLYAHDGLYYVDDGTLYKDGIATTMTGLSSAEKTFVSMQSYIIILPDKRFYNASDASVGNLESTASNISCTIKNGTYAGEDAEANTIYASGVTWSNYFKVGDAVTITGCTTHTENNKTPIIREIDGSNLIFYENTFTINEGGDTETITLTRSMPDMDFIFEHENRLWGCKKDTIYASKLGDPFNWNVFDGISTDSFSVDVGSAGDFTGAASYLGYPVFFKENIIYKMYGNKPTNYELISSASIGAIKQKSIAVANNTMFYLSRNGLCAYNGGIPSTMEESFGDIEYTDSVAGSDGIRYFASMKSGNTWTVFVYDTEHKVIEKEDNTQFLFAAFNDGVCYFIDSQNKLWASENVTGSTEENAVSSFVEFGDITQDKTSNNYKPHKKGFGRIQIKAEIAANSTLAVYMKYDNGNYVQVKSVSGMKQKELMMLTVIPKRCETFRIKLVGTGEWIVSGIAWETYYGSDY